MARAAMPDIRAGLLINDAAIERNVRMLCGLARPARVCAVVKADGYGHGAAAAGSAALRGGASVLAVATAVEAASLRAALDRSGQRDAELLVLGALTAAEIEIALDSGAAVSAWTPQFVIAVKQAAARRGTQTVAVHVKLDSGMGRLGDRDQVKATDVAELVARAEQTRLAGLWTHCATADDRDDEFFSLQLKRFRKWAEPLKRVYPDVILHAANSAALLRERSSHLDMVRCGVAIYGLDPFGLDAAAQRLRPALELRATVAAVKAARCGDSAGYGRRFVAPQETTLATIPVGYGDGYRRALGGRADVLIGGRRYPLAGTISMDNITVELGLGSEVRPGDEAVLLGVQGEESISAEQLARQIDTINYEITCGFGPRLPRIHHRDGQVEVR